MNLNTNIHCPKSDRDLVVPYTLGQFAHLPFLLDDVLPHLFTDGGVDICGLGRVSTDPEHRTVSSKAGLCNLCQKL